MALARPAAVLALFATLTAACAEAPAGVSAPEDARARMINGGSPTGSAYGNVGALLLDFDRDGVVEGGEAFCSGSLISPTVFVTAAHCVAWLPSTAPVHVSFDADLMPAPASIPASAFHYDPAYGRDMGDLHDIAVVVLPEGSTAGVQPLQLPTAGLLDELAARGGLKDQLFVNVGYGVAASRRGMPQFTYDGKRNYSKSPFMALQPAWLGLLMNSDATGEGGDCYGDSGSPKFFDGNPDLIVALVSTGDYPCRATTWDYRLDTPNARAFLGQFVALP